LGTGAHQWTPGVGVVVEETNVASDVNRDQSNTDRGLSLDGGGLRLNVGIENTTLNVTGCGDCDGGQTGWDTEESVSTVNVGSVGV